LSDRLFDTLVSFVVKVADDKIKAFSTPSVTTLGICDAITLNRNIYKIVIFYRHLAVSQKRHKICTQILQNFNRKLPPIMISLAITFDTDPSFKVIAFQLRDTSAMPNRLAVSLLIPYTHGVTDN